MVSFELKKIFKSKVNLVAMALGIVLVLVVFVSQNILGLSEYCVETDSYLTGKAALEYSRKLAASQGEQLTENMIVNYLRKVQAYEGDLNSDECYVDFIRKDGYLFYYMYYSYADINPTNDFEELRDIDLSKGSGFYERRIEKIRDYLNMDFSFGNYSEAEKAYWIEKAEQVETPFPWASKITATRYFDNIAIAFYLLFIVIVCISPMFSKESDTGAVQLLLTTKYGKTKLVKAKIAASMIFSLAYISLCMVLSVGLQAAYSGFQGMDLPIQIMNNALPYSMNIGQFCLLAVCINLVIAVSITAVMMLFSAFTKSSMGTMCFAMLLMVVPAFLKYSKYNGFYNHLIELSFVRLAGLKDAMLRFISFEIGPFVLDQISMCIIVWLLIAIICLLPTRKVFVNRIVKSR